MVLFWDLWSSSDRVKQVLCKPRELWDLQGPNTVERGCGGLEKAPQMASGFLLVAPSSQPQKGCPEKNEETKKNKAAHGAPLLPETVEGEIR